MITKSKRKPCFVTTTLSRKEADKLVRLARKYGCSEAALVERALELYIQKHRVPP